MDQVLAAKRESKHVEFKESFDPTASADWCELIKDVVAIGNSGGGYLCGQRRILIAVAPSTKCKSSRPRNSSS